MKNGSPRETQEQADETERGWRDGCREAGRFQTKRGDDKPGLQDIK